jgi:D-3-phosphoglycerate dehydrogenase
MMKIVAIGDALLPAKYMADALSRVDHSGNEIRVLSWGEDDEEKLDKRARNLELNGPTADSPPAEFDDHVADTELVMVHYCPVSENLLRRAKKLKILATCRMGTQNIDVNAATRHGILAFHVIGRTTEAVSDHTIGLLLCEARNIARADSARKKGIWRKSYMNSACTPELEGKTLGIVGFGEVGRAVLQKLKGFNMRFLVHDPFVSESDIAQCGGRKVGLDELVANSDFVTLHAVVTPESTAMIGYREIGLMKPTAYLINTARSELVDENALYDALRAQKIAGAAMDVFKDEPLPVDHPLLQLDNVTLTPHLASSTVECLSKSPRLLLDEIVKCLHTGDSRFILNPEVLRKHPFAHFALT